MKHNLGWFTWHGLLIGVLICVISGLLIYRRFEFTQQDKAEDVTTLKIKGLEQQLSLTRSRVEALGKQVNDVDSRLTALSKVGTKRNKKQ